MWCLWGILHGRGFLGEGVLKVFWGRVLHGRSTWKGLEERYFKTHGVFLKVFGGKFNFVDTYVTTYYKPLPPKKYFARTPYLSNK
jgi:hypothetical protein